MASSSATPRDLWEAAIKSLDPQVRERLAPSTTHVRDVVGEALKEAKSRREDSTQKRLRLPNGIIVRDVMEKTIRWIDCFKAVGDNAAQYDTGHAALPWAAVRFVLQSLINYSEYEQHIVEEIELTTRPLAIFRGVETSYLVPSATSELQDTLVSAYVAILETLAKAVKFFSEAKKMRMLKAPLRASDRKNIDRLLAKEHEVFTCTRLIDGNRGFEMNMKLERLADRSRVMDRAVEEEMYRKILGWLSQTKYREHHKDHASRRLSGTGQWLLQNPEYVSWQAESSCSTLVLDGIPGCGKTVLSSMVIDEHMHSSTSASTSASTKAPVAYFYCSAVASESDRQECVSVLRSLVRQLTTALSQFPKIHSALLAVYNTKLREEEKHGFHDIAQPSALECETLILDVLEDNPATIVIDAIDEINETERLSLLSSLRNLCDGSKNVLKIMVSSRESPAVFKALPAARHVRVTVKENHLDVKQFITDRVDKLIEQRKLLQDMRSEMIHSLCSRAGEMYQWAKLQLAQLEVSEVPPVRSDLYAKLSNLAVSTLDDLYGSIFDTILRYEPVALRVATHAFPWLLFAHEPLSVDMFLALTANAAGWDEQNPQDLLAFCRGFVYIDSQSRLVRLVHESVRVYLSSQPLFAPHTAQELISLSCLKLLEDLPPNEVLHLRPADDPYHYATLYCGHHLSVLHRSSISDLVSERVRTFLFDGEDVGLFADFWMTAVRTSFDALPQAHAQKVAMEVTISDPCSPIFPVCAFGLISILTTNRWQKDFDWDQRNSHGHTALYVGSYFGHVAVVHYLLEQGADPNIKCGRLGTAVQCAAYRGYKSVVELLSIHGADLKLQGKFKSAFHAACYGDQEDVVITLLEGRLNLVTQEDYDDAVVEVVKAGFARALSKLQAAYPRWSNSAAPSDKTRQRGRDAVATGKVSLLKRLIECSSFDSVVSKDSLATSSLHGHEEMTAFLITNTIDVDEPGPLGTPLRCASVYGHIKICELLIDHGAHVNSCARFGTALHAAAMRGHLHAARLLLDKGADVDACGGHYGTPLQAAAYHGHVELVNLFLDAKANVHLEGFSEDAIHAAVEGGHYDIVQLFWSAGYQSLTPPYGLQEAHARRISSPPPNILRESSPSRRTSRRKPSGRAVDARQTQGHAGTETDPCDPSKGPRPYKNVQIGDWGIEESSILEAAAALGRLGTVSMLLSEDFDPSLAKSALVAACDHGQPLSLINFWAMSP